MNKKNVNTMLDSGYASTLVCSSFSSDFKQLLGASASTPKKDNSINQQNTGISHNKSANGFKSLGEDISAQQKTTDYQKSNVLFDYKHFTLIALILLFAIFIIAYKMVLVAMPYTNTESFYEASAYAKDAFSRLLDWAQENQLSTRLNPLLCGLAVSIFSYMMVYFDSNIPGINPSTPFSSKRKPNYGNHKGSSININYLTAIASGVVVSALMWYEL